MAESTDFEDVGDDRLRETFKEASFPPTPRLEPLIGRRLRRRRLAIRGGVVAAAIVAAVWVVDRRWLRSSHEQVVEVPTPQSTIDRAHELADLPVLFALPPVDSFDLLSHQEAAFMTALQQMGKE